MSFSSGPDRSSPESISPTMMYTRIAATTTCRNTAATVDSGNSSRLLYFSRTPLRRAVHGPSCRRGSPWVERFRLFPVARLARRSVLRLRFLVAGGSLSLPGALAGLLRPARFQFEKADQHTTPTMSTDATMPMTGSSLKSSLIAFPILANALAEPLPDSGHRCSLETTAVSLSCTNVPENGRL